ncbi:MAG TPA: ABC transporter permease [Planctomycetota bacterium]|nr:ABC transporter permease [Planctomycetota bacterium]
MSPPPSPPLFAGVSRRLRQMRVMTAKELRQIARDRALLLFIIYSFTLHMFVAAGSEASDLRDARFLVRDLDRSPASRELISRFLPPQYLPAGEVASGEEALDRLDRGKAVMLLEIPEGFSRTLDEGAQPATVQLLVDTSSANTGYLASAYSARIAARYGAERAQANLSRGGAAHETLPRIESRDRVWFNPTLDEKWFATISELLTMITVACILLPAAALVREKERGTIEQLLVSPLTPFQVMFPKVLAMIVVTLLGTVVAFLGILRPVFGVPVRGSLLLFFGVTALYAFTNAGLGLLAATFTKRTAQVGMLMLLAVMPIIMLSGIRAPLESMPSWLRTAIWFSPLRHFLEVGYGILLRGAGVSVLWDSILVMAGLGAVLFLAGLYRFRRQLA